MVEDQDRIHKAFRILPDAGLILMPYAGWTWSEGGCDDGYVSGVQMIDWAQDELVLRASIPHHGTARRSFLHRERLLAVSDERIESFDITDRDGPQLRSSLVLARSVYRFTPVGDHLVQLAADWWTDEARLDVLPADQPNAAKPLASLDLKSVLRFDGDSDCERIHLGYYIHRPARQRHDGLPALAAQLGGHRRGRLRPE